MTTEQQKFILGYKGDMAIHFAKAIDGSKSIELRPLNNDTSFDTPETGVMTFTSAAAADAYKDHLCHVAAAQEFPQYVRSNSYTPYPLETYCDLTIQELAIA